ncbi:MULTISPECIES: iron ABC transporter permease [unclassified Saccharibacter]|uniref:FecCD family ABC transporter permease n=1 Tax=unclassified Saccharibacter TaxID=2648722 RepID=UPI001325B6C8|nr:MULTISPECIES: iron ABC transporter permease [unclassified Saccharibacter]MXV36209.1 iron chelate uptake ABC transporter family permease subunit [Saccharibacter sp. EH611]MXV57069.1 iron chelate uptake ABC transporter family permease subunit [Saccharibacter sp. EH70]MXV66571.1 iron chelate uptake ABC transporter family permease subunit [Saccharibacter sp. EH60]
MFTEMPSVSSSTEARKREKIAQRLTGMRQSYAKLTHHRVVVLLVLGVLILASLLLDFSLGPAALSPMQLVHALLNPSSGMNAVIVWHIRLPYALMAVLVGLALGISGGEMQTILDNPLASPFTLGVSAAAAFGASLAIVLQWRLPYMPETWMVPLEAFIFAVGSAVLLELVARVRARSTTMVVLFGIALVFTFHALVSLMQFVADEDALQELVFWTMGSLTRASWGKIAVLAAGCLVVLPFCWRAAPAMTALRLGEDRAASYGVDVHRLRMMSLLRVSILSALAVSFVGTIGFVGLVAPHIARRLLGEDHRFYLPGSALCGCLIMSLSSIAAKNIMSGVVIPVGIVTALVGIPFFLGVVLKRGR